VQGDVKDAELMKKLVKDCDHFVAGAAMIGGISYFHKYAYDLIAENERITASSFDAAIHAFKGKKKLRKVTLLSSYGFQKLATEYFARGAHEQYGLPYTIVRPFNCVGIGEGRALGEHEVFSGNVKLAMSHVVPDLVQKVLKGQDPLRILGDGQQVR